LDNTDIFTSNKGKASVSTNGIETYSKKTLGDKIRKLIAINVQLIINKIETKKAKVNLKVDRTQLFDKKNSLVIKRKEFRTEIVILNAINVLIRGH